MVRLTPLVGAVGVMRSKDVFADGLRGIAAISVLMCHYVLAFWAPGPTIGLIANVPDLPQGVAPAVSKWLLETPMTFSLAAFGVSLFFLISGYVIPLSLDRLDTVAFARARVWRILPTYAFGFCFTQLALLVAAKFYGRPFPYETSDVLAHFIPGVRLVARTPFIDYVIWTLEIEVVFYIVCLLTAPLIRAGSLLVLVVPTVLLFLASPTYGFPAYVIAGYAPALDFMFVGVLISFHRSEKIGPTTTIAAIAFVLATSLYFTYTTRGLISLVSYIFAAAMFITAYLFRAHFPDIALLRGLSAISYPLYVVHGLMGYVAMRIMLDHGVPPAGVVVLATLLALAVSTAIHFLVEKPTQKIGRTPSIKLVAQAAE